mmetsp:Transcript_91169/g.162325  ORF Transcript_91169/g.162325 Transcript_91169/m.162325 type:complete len:631 (+) Transcript_91169:152-2044(+)
MAIWINALRRAGFLVLGLMRHTQTLRSHLQTSCHFHVLRLLLRLVLHLLLTLLVAAERNHDKLSRVQIGAEILPLIDSCYPVVALLESTLVHCIVDVFKSSLDICNHRSVLAGDLRSLGIEDVPLGHDEFTFLNVHWSKLHSKWHPLHFPVVELPSRRICAVIVEMNTHAGLLQLHVVIHRHLCKLCFFRVCACGLDPERNDDDLDSRNSRRQDQALVITVDHNHDANSTLSESPRILVRMLKNFSGRVLWILEGDSKHLRKVLTKVVGSCALDGTARSRDERLHSGGVVRTRESLCLCLGAAHYRNGQEFLVDPSVEVKDFKHFLLSTSLVREGCVAFLPEELACPQERCRLFHFPSDNTAPLIELDWKISVGLDPVGVCCIHGSLTCWPDCNWLFNFLIAKFRHHGQFWCKIIQVVAFFLHVALGDEHGEVAVFDLHLLDLCIKPALDLLPELVCPRPQDEAALHRILFDELRFHDDLAVPLWHIISLLYSNTSSLGWIFGDGRRCSCWLLLFLFLCLLLGLSLCSRLCSGRFGRSITCARSFQLRELCYKAGNVAVCVDVLAAQALPFELLLYCSDLVPNSLDLRLQVTSWSWCPRSWRGSCFWSYRLSLRLHLGSRFLRRLVRCRL